MKPASPPAAAPPLSWCDALEAEFVALRGFAPVDDTLPRGSDARLRAVHARIHAEAQGTSALCLSGGGIRSATFALGVLQGLAHAGVLKHIDYLSTVSGGGYTGGWLTTWLHREGLEGRDDVMRELDPATAAQAGGIDEASPVDRLRRTCRYLAPNVSVVSADVWTLVMTMARNLALNWCVILPLLAAALLVPRLYFAVVHSIENNAMITTACEWRDYAGYPQWFIAATLVGFVISSAYVVLTFVGRSGQWSQGRFLSFFLLPAVASAVAFTLFWSATPCPMDLGESLFLGAVIPGAGWFVIGGARHGYRGVALTLAALVAGLTAIWHVTGQLALVEATREGWRALATVILLPLMAGIARRRWPVSEPNDGSTLRIRVGARTVLAAIISGPIIAGGTYWFATLQFGFGTGLDEFYAAFAVPIILSFSLLNIIVFIGIASKELDDSVLEWWSRTCGWLAIAILIWAGAGLVVFYMADWIEAGVRLVATEVNYGKMAAGLTVVVPLLSSLAGLAARGGSGKSKAGVALEAVALPLVILLLVSSIAWVNLIVVKHLEDIGPRHLAPCIPGQIVNPCYTPGAALLPVATLFGGFLVFGLLMSRVIPANRFSLHGMYRQRLIRTFLGASRRARRPNAFTGFDSQDDMRVHDLADVRPLHIINTTLNAVQSTQLGRHERQAQSMTFSPLHVGNRFVGYRPADQYGSDAHGRGTGISLGMALAVSGAAASSSLGIHSSKARAFLLTLANARLGLWFGNPASPKTWQRSDPPLGVEPLAREMLGLTTDHNPYVYLSDGGHYENLALWEMVARRCRFIIISDAGCDPTYCFEDLANAVRRIRLDLGIPIGFVPMSNTREGQGRSNTHFAIGKVEYSAVDGPGARDGTILYMKATLSGDESVDVRHFAQADPLFPHDSTANQFFDEARFESYRDLGFHTVQSATAGAQGLDSAEALLNCVKTVDEKHGLSTTPGPA